MWKMHLNDNAVSIGIIFVLTKSLAPLKLLMP